MTVAMRTLLGKELKRFYRVGFQTIAAPIISALLYLMIFSHVLQDKITPFEGVTYSRFLVPGLVMMAILQNAFANSGSSLIQSRVTGNMVFILLPPISHVEIFFSYVLASIVRGMVVGFGVFLVTFFFIRPELQNPLWVLIFAFIGSGILGTMGVIAGIWAERFDQMAAFQNFFIMPMTFLSGVFYSVKSLPSFWQGISHLNPFFYMVDGFRYGFFGVSDANPWLSLAVVLIAYAIVSAIGLRMLISGYKLRN